MKPTPSSDKKRVIVDYKNVTQDILELFTDRYPYGYEDEDIIKFKNAKGETVRAVPFETKDTKYLVKVSVEMDAKIEAYMDDDEDDDDTVAGDDANLEAPEEADED
ncbi:hypothetical protein [Owenweeksia hongkongensis]|uniref:Uncharacterized protein n=1 Tax=Owenweeksia hongkongensis (strain DSM 17368 / CIP 108786 / JCM 12287 / NRRL B-23963 / UST20020801) TaxID=926562 RepID=G8R735_OWEHD|nr:hypothetical protein [Owenweeksia hongkongensis]AEV33400.1 hypothetical protein Oweho_2430 [Owenweeksia hongkongensis DSM 17368]